MTATHATPADGGTVVALRHVRFSHDAGATWTLDDVSLTVEAGERVALTGPNGSGKSTLARLIAGLTAPDRGTVVLLGHTVCSPAPDGAAMPDPDAYRLARRGIGMVFQQPDDQLVTTVLEDDVAFGPENLAVPREPDDLVSEPDAGDSGDLLGARVDAALHAVGLADLRGADPTRMSGGQQQRAAIAGMLAMRPRLLVLDEPTAMLDPAARADVMDVVDALHAQGVTIVHVTHHADEVARAERVIRLEEGRIVSYEATSDEVTSNGDVLSGVREAEDGVRAPTRSKPFGRACDRRMHAIPRSLGSFAGDDSSDGTGTVHAAEGGSDALLDVDGVSFAYPDGHQVLHGASLRVRAGETVALRGANGSGKSTLLRLVCALERPSSGEIRLDGERVDVRDRHGLRRVRGIVGLVMQHPERQLFAATVREDVAYGPSNQGLSAKEIDARVDEAMALAGVAHLADSSPLALSGGQRRMVAIAGVLACRPRLLVMDEPTVGLDGEARGRVAALLEALHRRGVAVLLVTHDGDFARHVADRVVDMDEVTAAADAPAASHNVSQDVSQDVSQSVSYDGPSEAASIPDAPLARLDPRALMAATLVTMFSLFAVVNVWQLLLAASFTAGLVAASRIPPRRLFDSIKAFLGLFSLMGALNVCFVGEGTVLWRWGPLRVTDAGVDAALFYTLRFALVLIQGAVFLRTVTPTAVVDAFASLLSPLERLGVHVRELALVLGLALRFIPTLAGETRALMEAQAARGGSVESGSLPRRLQAMGAVVVPAFAGALRHADHLALALDARCYEQGARRTHWRVMRLHARDAWFLTLVAAYLAALLMLA